MTQYLKKNQAKEKRKQLVASYESNGDWRSLAVDLGVSKFTAYRWVREGDKTDKRGGSRYQKVHEEHKKWLAAQIESNPRITLEELREGLFQNLGLKLSTQGIRIHLDAMLYTLKAIRYEPERANLSDNKVKRKQFVETLLGFQSENQPVVYMDETNFNIHISRSQGRSLSGSRCSVVAAGSKGANIHVIGGISSLGVIHYEIRRGSFKKEQARAWVKECLRQARRKHCGPVVLVIDNAPCHSGIEEVLLDPEFSDHRILRLAPYSPMFNPIESVWSMVKAHVKRALAEKLDFILRNEDRFGISKSEYRLRELEGLIIEAISKITPLVCNNFIAKILNLIPKAINLEDMEY